MADGKTGTEAETQLKKTLASKFNVPEDDVVITGQTGSELTFHFKGSDSGVSSAENALAAATTDEAERKSLGMSSVSAAAADGGTGGEEKKDDNMLIYIIVGSVAGVLLIGIVVGVVIKSRKPKARTMEMYGNNVVGDGGDNSLQAMESTMLQEESADHELETV